MESEKLYNFWWGPDVPLAEGLESIVLERNFKLGLRKVACPQNHTECLLRAKEKSTISEAQGSRY